jgi:hypothetical protein
MEILSRQARRAQERELLRKSLSKAERKIYARMDTPVQNEVYYSILAMNVGVNEPTG